MRLGTVGCFSPLPLTDLESLSVPDKVISPSEEPLQPASHHMPLPFLPQAATRQAVRGPGWGVDTKSRRSRRLPVLKLLITKERRNSVFKELLTNKAGVGALRIRSRQLGSVSETSRGAHIRLLSPLSGQTSSRLFPSHPPRPES